MSATTMRADRRPWRRLIWCLAALLIASQTHAVVHALQHVTPALAEVHADAQTTQADHDHGASAHHGHASHDLSLSCELCAAGHVTLAGLPFERAAAHGVARWIEPAAEHGRTSPPLHPLCRDPPFAV